MFVYYNANPYQEITKDCVIRAISTALNIDYDCVLKLLYENSEYFNCDMLVRDCYGKVLDEVFHLTKLYGNGALVKEIAEEFKDKKVIMRIKDHLTCSIYGDVLDIWDTSYELVDVFWIVNK